MSSCDGKVKASASGGNPPYTLTIGFPVTISVTSNVSCHGGSDASATGSPSGGSGTYTSYSWMKGNTQASTVQNPTNLSAGTYTLTVTDSNGVQGSSSVEITQPDALSITTSSKTDVAIAGQSDGAINLNVSGGTAPYTYLWNDDVTDANRTGLTAGTYTVTVTDKNKCTATHPVTIAENSVITVGASVHKHVLCNGDSNGSAIGSASGGSGTYISYSWEKDDNEVSTVQNPTNLSAGTYTLTVTDSVGATGISSSITIDEPDALVVTSEVIPETVATAPTVTVPSAFTTAQKACDPTADLDGYIYDNNHYVIRYIDFHATDVNGIAAIHEFYVYGSESSSISNFGNSSQTFSTNTLYFIPSGATALFKTDQCGGYLKFASILSLPQLGAQVAAQQLHSLLKDTIELHGLDQISSNATYFASNSYRTYIHPQSCAAEDATRIDVWHKNAVITRKGSLVTNRGATANHLSIMNSLSSRGFTSTHNNLADGEEISIYPIKKIT